jgi:hypothetical protein
VCSCHVADASCDAEAISICHAKGPFLRALSSAIGRRRLTGSGFAGPFTRIVTTGNQRVLLLKIVSVNYAIRFSGPVTALTARCVRYGVGPDFICRPGPSPGRTRPPPLFPWALYLPAPSARALGCYRALLAPCQPPQSPQNRYDAASGKNVAMPRLALIRSELRPSDPCIDPSQRRR